MRGDLQAACVFSLWFIWSIFDFDSNASDTIHSYADEASCIPLHRRDCYNVDDDCHAYSKEHDFCIRIHGGSMRRHSVPSGACSSVWIEWRHVREWVRVGPGQLQQRWPERDSSELWRVPLRYPEWMRSRSRNWHGKGLAPNQYTNHSPKKKKFNQLLKIM